MQKYFRVLLLILFSNAVSAQSGGVSIQSGLTYGFSQEEALTKSGQAHYGWMAGLDARLMGGDMYFLVGGPVSYTHLRAHETVLDLVCRLLLEKKTQKNQYRYFYTHA